MLSRRLIQKLEALNADDLMHLERQTDLMLHIQRGAQLRPAVGATPAVPAWWASCAAVKGTDRLAGIAVPKPRQAKLYELFPPPLPRARRR